MSVERPLDPNDRDALRKRHLAALEALFAPKPNAPVAPPPSSHPASGDPRARALVKIVRAHAGDADPRKERVLARLLGAEGPRAIARATREVERAGYAVPEDQETSLQMLAHPDEARVRRAIAAFARALADEPIKRRAVVEARVRRVEELAEEPETRDAARALAARLARPQA